MGALTLSPHHCLWSLLSSSAARCSLLASLLPLRLPSFPLFPCLSEPQIILTSTVPPLPPLAISFFPFLSLFFFPFLFRAPDHSDLQRPERGHQGRTPERAPGLLPQLPVPQGTGQDGHTPGPAPHPRGGGAPGEGEAGGEYCSAVQYSMYARCQYVCCMWSSGLGKTAAPQVLCLIRKEEEHQERERQAVSTAH